MNNTVVHVNSERISLSVLAIQVASSNIFVCQRSEISDATSGKEKSGFSIAENNG